MGTPIRLAPNPTFPPTPNSAHDHTLVSGHERLIDALPETSCIKPDKTNLEHKASQLHTLLFGSSTRRV